MRDIDGLQRFGQRADLVDLDQQRIGEALADPVPQTVGIGDEQIVAHQLDGVADPVGQRLPPCEIVFRHPVLDRADRIVAAQFVEIFGHALAIERQPFA